MFEDSYNMKWKLRDDEGFEWWEEFFNISLLDFEVIYEKNLYLIVQVEMNLIQNGVVS